MKLLYIGNKLASSGRTPTTIDTLGLQFEEFAEVVSVSDKFNKIARLIDMCLSVFKHKDTDYVIIDTYSSSAFYFALLVSFCCKILHKKYIPILHGGNLPARLDNSPRLSKYIFKSSYINVSPSGYLNYEFSVRGYTNVVTIPNNISINDYSFKERNVFTPKLLWVRSFAEIYNCTMAIEVLNILIQKYPDAQLCMVGPDKDGSMQKVTQLAEKYGIIDFLRITGKLQKEEWHNLSEDYDIFISTTNFDNTPVSVIEAMSLGLPVISTSVGGVPYLIEDGTDGLLVDKGNAKQMAEAIINVLEDQQLAISLSRNARKKVESFDWNVVKRQWQTILK